MNEPVHTDASRRVRVATTFKASTSAGSIGRPINASPPATINVSADSTDEILSVTANGIPTEVCTARPPTDATVSR